MAGLPTDSPYHQTNSPGLWASLRQLWSDAILARQLAKSKAQSPSPAVPRQTIKVIASDIR
jgi:hypothetical protein